MRKLDDSFEAENKIQIAYPEVMPSMTGANVNLRFNSFGSVNVKFADDAERKVKTKVMREKSVYCTGCCTGCCTGFCTGCCTGCCTVFFCILDTSAYSERYYSAAYILSD